MDRKRFIEEIRRLEKIVGEQGTRIVELEGQLDLQGNEVESVARASMEVRAEDVAQLAQYQEQNSALINFVEEIAQTKSKFAKKARNLLGM